MIAITRAGFDKVKTRGREHAPFVIRVATSQGEREYLASAVIDATGTWSQPNPLGAYGLPARGEAALRAHIAYGMPDVLGSERGRYAGRRVLVAGAGHSAAGSLLALATLAEQAAGTRVAWAIRGTQDARLFGGGVADSLPARGELGMRLKALQQAGRLELHGAFRIVSLARTDGAITVRGEEAAVIEGIDEIIAATGARPNLDITRELRVRHDPWLESTDLLAPLIDPNEHSCGTVRPHGHRELAHPEQGYYAVGAKSYGRAPNFLMVTGYEQVRSVVVRAGGRSARRRRRAAGAAANGRLRHAGRKRTRRKRLLWRAGAGAVGWLLRRGRPGKGSGKSRMRLYPGGSRAGGRGRAAVRKPPRHGYTLHVDRAFDEA
ncbi:NAD(P)-binding domain-containing protein [Massilia sp. Se16.2.3]|uniref:NAD(P)-binding domain-containing protein n=1 Tax=Massilia sp. Se16.2.3 TaxID=2709303 RepID=UPI0028050E30|nr:NAD(P)-binding domain-containing protein [Massilia sp. Se16.2.3]